MGAIIQLSHISKKYGQQKVFENFSYKFPKIGGVLLFGPSGCGKTTLLNIIAGIESLDEGDYLFNQQKIINSNMLYQEFAYITQDVYLIDYLTVQENLKLSCEKKDEILKWCTHFDIMHLLDCYPNQLSGGEKQRVALIQGLCSNKKVFLLDEPTASLDEENKIKIFEILKELSLNLLIICVSHDEVSLKYFDNVIDFNDLENYQINIESTQKQIFSTHVIEQKESLYPFVLMQKRKDEEKTGKYLTIIFSMCMLLFCFSLKPENKIINSLFDVYDLNYLKVIIPLGKEKLLDDVQKEYSIAAIVYDYDRGADYKDIPKNDDEMINHSSVPYSDSLLYKTLPLGTCFKGYDYLEAGSYFTEPYQIMLSYQKALEYSDNVASLIGEKIEINTSHGKEKFEIAGIFKPFTNELLPYLKYGYDVENINSTIFFNHAYTQSYLEDDQLCLSEKSTYPNNWYTLYFDTPKEVKRFYDIYKNNDIKKQNTFYIQPIEYSYGNTITTFISASFFLIPICVLSFILAIFFYIVSKYNQMFQTRINFSVYHYYGYPWKIVYYAYCRYFIVQISRYVSIAFMSTIFVSWIINLLNYQLSILPFPIFNVDIQLLVYLSIFLIISLSIFISLMLLSFKKHKWYDNLRIGRDLL